MNRCPRCLREIPDTHSICDRCAYEEADPGEGQPTLESVLRQAAASAPENATGPAAASTQRLLVFGVTAGLALCGTVAFALLSKSGSPDPVPATAPGAAVTPAGGVMTPDPAVTPVWRANPDWVGRQKRAMAFELPADHRVPVWMRQSHPHLVVRCTERRTDLFVYTESAAQIEPEDGRHTVRITLDDEPERTERWQDSDEHDALFAPDGHAFVQRLLTAKTLRIGYKPHNAAAVVIHFSVGGLEPLIAPFARQCGWTR
ncbi:MAG TPA: type VI secretion system-associated protein TagO [Vicinamibacterales bacterium]|nr:type VI secretion system-associated protein TagO [Vicinamibacterales bacterium]